MYFIDPGFIDHNENQYMTDKDRMNGLLINELTLHSAMKNQKRRNNNNNNIGRLLLFTNLSNIKPIYRGSSQLLNQKTQITNPTLITWITFGNAQFLFGFGFDAIWPKSTNRNVPAALEQIWNRD